MENDSKFKFVFKMAHFGDNSTEKNHGNQLVLANASNEDQASELVYLQWVLYFFLVVALIFASKLAYKTFLARSSVTMNFISSSDMALHSTASNCNRFRHFFSFSKPNSPKNLILESPLAEESKNSAILSISGACSADSIIQKTCIDGDTSQVQKNVDGSTKLNPLEPFKQQNLDLTHEAKFSAFPSGLQKLKEETNIKQDKMDAVVNNATMTG